DVRMVESGDNTSFPLEAGKAFWIAGHLWWQYFKGHFAAEFRVGGAIHLTHSARADRSGDPIMRERTTDQFAPPGSQAVISCGFVAGPRQLVTQAVVGGMRQRRWGRIINLSSVAAQTGGGVRAHLAASKAGII